MSRLYYDLHIHSALSPCGSDDMTPANLVGTAKLNGLDVIALTDHNSTKNCPAAIKCGEAYGITVIPGMELTTSEDVHVVCLFSDLKDAMAFDEYVYEHLMDVKNKPDIFGHQYVMNEDDEVLYEVEKLLINATDISFDNVPSVVSSFNGVYFPAHVDKSTTSLLSNLGFIPPESEFKTAEVFHIGLLDELLENEPYLKGCRIIHDSDAHYLEDIHTAEYSIDVPKTDIKSILEYIKNPF